jgi:hypothetical protein
MGPELTDLVTSLIGAAVFLILLHGSKASLIDRVELIPPT